MNLDIVCSSEALEHIKILSHGMGENEDGFGLGEEKEIVAELIYGQFEFEEYNYFNLSFPQDYTPSSSLPYFYVGNIRVSVRSDKMAEKIKSKELIMKNNELDFV